MNNIPEERPRLKQPVAWLLGRDLIASLQGTLLYIAFGSKLDPRTWMKAEKIDFKPHPERKDEFWFDYISDTGDGMKATYSIAYLAMSNLYIKDDIDTIPSNTEVRLIQKKRQDDEMTLPRGQFLLVGGDTSYHLSDYATLANRFYMPFRWAFQDLWNDLSKSSSGTNVELENLKIRRPIFGIPGNHDYYDQLDGFRRQFRKPTNPEADGGLQTHLPPISKTDVPELMLPGFRCTQTASYIGLKLPFNWWLWGLDTELGLIDAHQEKFFLDLKKEEYPDKLILATCSPTTFFGRFAREDDKKSAEAIAQLELSQPFLPTIGNEPLETRTGDAILKDGQCRVDLSGDFHMYARYWGPNSEKEPGESDAENDRRKKSPAERPHANSYASVVSGLGGAFHHPSQTFLGDLKEQVIYPSENRSRQEFSKRLFSFGNVFLGGGVGYIGFCLAFIIYFTATIPTSSLQTVENTLSGIGLTPQVQFIKTVETKPTPEPFATPKSGEESATALPEIMPQPTSEITNITRVEIDTPWLWQLLCYQNLLCNSSASWTPNIQQSKKGCRDYFFFGPCRIESPPLYWLSPVLIIVSLISFFSVILTFPKFGKTSKKIQKDGKEKIIVGEDEAKQPEQPPAVPPVVNNNNEPHSFFDRLLLQQKVINFGKSIGSYRQLIYLSIAAASALILFAGLFTIKPYRNFITPFGQSMLVFSTFIWAALAGVLSIFYSEWLFNQASSREIRQRDWVLPWTLLILGILIVASGLWSFAIHNTPAYIVTDIIFMIATFGILILIVFLAYKVGGADLKGSDKLPLFIVIGIWHAILQLAVPYLLIRKGSWLALLLAAIATVVFWLIGRELMKRDYRWLLLATWFVFGALMLFLPFIVFIVFKIDPQDTFVSYWGDVNKLFPANSVITKQFYPRHWLVPAIAGIIGLFTSCIWLGWYLAVSLSFNGHNNEAGGAGRIEDFKEFIRFRVRDKDITGYVIAVDKPQEKGSELQPKLIDVFKLKVKAPSSSEAE